MSFLTLVRHAQASFFADDYDQLSPLGRTQAGLLGDHWVSRRQLWDEVYTGPRTRQRHTAELVGARYRQARLSWPEPVVLPELDESDLGGILGRLAPDLARQDRTFSELMDRYQQSMERDERARSFQRMFEALMSHWQAAEEATDGVESCWRFRPVCGAASALSSHAQSAAGAWPCSPRAA